MLQFRVFVCGYDPFAATEETILQLQPEKYKNGLARSEQCPLIWHSVSNISKPHFPQGSQLGHKGYGFPLLFVPSSWDSFAAPEYGVSI